MDKPQVRISVRNLVEFILRSGDINLSGYVSGQSMTEGTKIHKKLQKEAGIEYKPEVRLSYKKDYDSFCILVEGIADGIITTDKGITIDEIKTVRTPLEYVDEDYNLLHWAQAKCYAYMYAFQHELGNISIRLTYYNVNTSNIKYIVKDYTLSELDIFFGELLDKYFLWAKFEVSHRESRNKSIEELEFPFLNYRKGQRDLAAAVYYSIRDKKKLFAQAPTGIGKTISVMFPAVKAMGQEMGEKIFYLTAKTVTRQVAEEALQLMQQKGLDFKSITITSKERLCPSRTRKCDAEHCAYAKGHYDRVNEAIMDIIVNENIITHDILDAYSNKHMVCPFEYTLDIAEWADCIICDYNYVFDPRAYLRRFFEYGGDYTVLIDEAHNLVDRAREMFSIELTKKAFMKVKKEIKSKAPGIYDALNSINKFFIDLRKSFSRKFEEKVIDLPVEIYPHIERFIDESEAYLIKGGDIPESFMELFFDCISFIAVYRLYDERYVTYAVREDDEVKFKLFCADPSNILFNICKKMRASVFFSATLLPINYYKYMLGGKEEDLFIRLSSPFKRSNLCLMIQGKISTRYKDRENSYKLIALYIHEAVKQKNGNYLVFFPSYEYMKNVYKLYTELWPEEQTIIQNDSMNDEEREEFLSKFQPRNDITLTAFAVMGGIFSEGIDLAGERLSGTIIIGVGLPQLCLERDIISRYFNDINANGYEYAYMYPGMNRVLQAAGRVIRTESDRGFVLLVDDRFLQSRYLEIFPPEWNGFKKVYSIDDVKRIIGDFWRNEY